MEQMRIRIRLRRWAGRGGGDPITCWIIFSILFLKFLITSRDWTPDLPGCKKLLCEDEVDGGEDDDDEDDDCEGGDDDEDDACEGDDDEETKRARA